MKDIVDHLINKVETVNINNPKANPGSKLKTAVTTKPSKLKKGSKDAKRRASFCARMKGMRKRQKPSNNTGEDRLSKSLRKWNC